MSYVMCVACPGGTTSSLLRTAVKNGSQRGLISRCRAEMDFSVDAEKHPILMTSSSSSQERVQEMIRKQAAVVRERSTREGTNSWNLDEAYGRCLELFTIDACSAAFTTSCHHPLNLALSSLVKLVVPVLNLQEQDQLKALSALAVWCRRTDELVDGINGCCATPEVLDRWEQRLIDLYEGRPHDMYDAALSHSLSKYPIDLQLFKEFMEGIRMDTRKTRYENFDELYLYMYGVAGTVGIMIVQVLGTSSESKAPLESIYNSAIAIGIALQLSDILKDVREDARMGRMYLPQDELAKAGLSEDDITSGPVTNEWRNFMKEQIKRVREYADEGEKFIDEMNWSCRLMFWVTSLGSRKIVDKIEENDYDLRKPAPVDMSKALPALLVASGKTIAGAFRFP